MNVQEALNVFGLSGKLTEQGIRKAYKQTALKFHPDKNRENPLAAEMMKAINAAHDFLLADIDKINQYQKTPDTTTGKNWKTYSMNCKRCLA